MNRTKITEHDDRRVTITFMDRRRDQMVTMEIWAASPPPSGWSYVRYSDGSGDRQLCDRLSSQGSTLTYYEGTKLVDLVRREYRAMRSAEKRAADKEFRV